MDQSKIIAEIKSGVFKPIYFLHGEEGYFIDAISNAILEHALTEDEKAFNLNIVYGKEAEAGALIAEAKGFPMMSQRRVVVVKEAQEFKGIEDLASYFESPSPQTVFVVCYKYKKYDARKKSLKSASKNGVVFNSESVKEYKLVDWITTYVKGTGYGISPKASMLLAEFLGNDLSRIVNELDKLTILIEKGTTISDIHIEENIGVSKDYNVFELVNAVSIRDVLKANKIINYFQHNPKAAASVVVISNLFNHFARLMRIHFLENKSKESVAGALRIHPFVATQLLGATKIYNPKKIAANIAILHEYDLKSKGLGNSSFSQSDLMKELIYKLMH